MGVPAFFRWLTKKYPSVIVHCIEEKVQEIDGVTIPLDTTAPNPNGVEFDNLYLDMNGIIHPCTHPENKPAPKNEEEMMVAIFECIDRLFRIVRPRKLLYMAIDGVAPRAKMNQQRSRRFRATKEVAEKINEIERIRAELEANGCTLPPAKPKGEHFDSNCITPGTPFMDRLAKCLHYYVHERMNTDPGWKNIKVILSDANSPGEGEHKIMDYIRRQRAQPGHDPNTSHCLCGADADLIMLGLATHEPNFTIIREEFKPNAPRPCEICNTVGHDMKDCLGIEKEVPADGPEPPAFSSEPEFIFVRVNVLREYLEKELQMPNLPFTFDLERAVDDWVFMCFFVGNDFLPHLPSLEIRENAIDRLVRLYKDCVYKTGGWLTNSGIPDLNRVQLIMSNLGKAEDEIFYRRQENEIHFKARMKAQKKRKRDGEANCYSLPAHVARGQFAPLPIGQSPSPVRSPREEAYNMRVQGMHTNADGNIARSNQNAAAALKAMLTSSEPPSPTSGSANDSISSIGSSTSIESSPGNVSVSASPSREPAMKRKANTAIESDDEEPNDEVRLWEEGFKNRYYESKFDVAPDNFKFRQEVANQYVRGLCWVLRYYYQGCASWEWYFPYHYAPFASDLINIGDLSTEFEKDTKPFFPMEQLMSVFPAASRAHVPEPWGKLMYDPESPIIDFYPVDFQIDLNGKKFAWQGVALLPFVDEKRLKAVLADYQHLLTDDEIRRNSRGDDRLYVKRGHESYEFLTGLYENSFDPNTEVPLDPALCQGMGGVVLLASDLVPPKGSLKCPILGLNQADVSDNETVTVRFRDLKFDPDHIFPAIRLKNAVDPPKVLKPGDLTPDQSRNWRPQIGMARATQRASLDASGHRALGNYTPRGGGGQGAYSNMPPPNQGSGGGGGGFYNSRNDSSYGGGGSRNASSGGSYDRNSGSSYDRGSGGYNSRGGGGGYRGSSGGGGGSRYNSGEGGGYTSGSGYSGGYSSSGQSGGYSSGGRSGGYSSGGGSSGYNSGGSSGSYNSGGGSRGGYRGGSGGGYRGGGQQGYGGGSSSNWRSDDDRRSSRGGGSGGQREGYFTTGYNQQRR